MKLDQIPACQGRVFLMLGLPPQFPCSHLRNRRRLLLFGAVSLRYGNRNVRLLESGNLIVVGNLRIDLVGFAIGQVEMQRLRTFAYENALLCEGNSRRRWNGGISDKNALPDGRTLGCFHILYIEDQPGKAFVENAWLDFEGRLRRFQVVL